MDTAVASTYSQEESVPAGTAQAEIAHLVDDVPRFQVAVPENFDAWNAATYTPLVAYMPQGVDDKTLKTITAYDAAGTAIQLDAQTAPTVPVIVLGVNERTDDSGNPLPSGQEAPSKKTSTQAAAALAAASYEVRLTKVHLNHDNEPWALGAAEISMRAKSVGCSGTAYTDIDMFGLDDDGDTLVTRLVAGGTTCAVIFYWWEDDGAKFNFNLSFNGAGLGVQMDNDDDLIGGAQLPYSSFSGGSDRLTRWSDLEMWTD